MIPENIGKNEQREVVVGTLETGETCDEDYREEIVFGVAHFLGVKVLNQNKIKQI